MDRRSRASEMEWETGKKIKREKVRDKNRGIGKNKSRKNKKRIRKET